jgi:glycosyltransferase involved in cell wall biosynthesis
MSDDIKNSVGTMKVTVAIITKNEVRNIQKCLESICDQTMRPFEIVVVDATSTDGTLEIIQRFPARIFVVAEGSYSHQRQICVEKARGDVIAFIDGDCYAHKSWLEELTKALRRHEVVGSYGQIAPWDHYGSFSSWLALLDRKQRILRARRGKRTMIGSGNLAVKRDCVIKAGGFDQRFSKGAEDYDLTYRMTQHGEITFTPNAITYSRMPTSYVAFLKRDIRHSAGWGHLFLKHGYGIDPRFLAQYVTFAVTSILVLVCLFSPYRILALGFAGAYCIFLLLYSIYLYNKHRDQCVFHVLATQPLFIIGLVLGTSYGILRTVRRTLLSYKQESNVNQYG